MAKTKTEDTPLMQQHKAIKQKYPDAILLFRVGDFYETFGEDAIKASKILGIVLTKRGNGVGTFIELAGFPHHSLDNYLPKLVRAGQRVAICDQLEDPKLAKGIVKRGITELVTPGVSYNDTVLDIKTNNFLASLHFGKNDQKGEQIGISLLDISTGDFMVTQGTLPYIEKLLQGFRPSEIIYSRAKRQECESYFNEEYNLFTVEDWVYQYDYAHEKLTKHFNTVNLKGFGIDNQHNSIIAAGAILFYLENTEHHEIKHIATISRIEEEKYVWLDKFTIRNLELLYPQQENGVPLIDILDETITPMGARLLKNWLVLPLKSVEEIEKRQEIVQYFYENEEITENLTRPLKNIGDLERLISKVSAGRINPREMNQLRRALQNIIPIKELLAFSPTPNPSPKGGELTPSPLGKVGLGLNPPPFGEGLGVGLHSGEKLVEGLNYAIYRTANSEKWKKLKELARENRKNPTPAEVKFWHLLRGDKLGFNFRRQHTIQDFIVDFVCLEKKLIVEVDGDIHHLPENQDYDLGRTYELNQLGYDLVRFTNNEVLENGDEVVEKIKGILSGNIDKSLNFSPSSLTPNPSPKGGELLNSPPFREGLGVRLTPPPFGEGLGVGLLSGLGVLDLCTELLTKIDAELLDEVPLVANQGNLIRENVHAELDELRRISSSGKDYLEKIQQQEAMRTGIPSLKISYNKVFGYYLEVRNLHKDKVPKEWIRKQTLSGAERYITEELKIYEEKILTAEDKIVAIEQQLFWAMVEKAKEFIAPIQRNAKIIARIDCMSGFAAVARKNNYAKPILNDSKIIDIRDGRHPVIEKQLAIGEDYVPNDVFLDDQTQQIMIITGPNMAGKSALLRQTALIVLMAQMGSFVPASSANIGLVDKVFTRVGASDNLSKGESTFMVEMTETASILNNLSDRSLVLMDEIGRGTSTYDGISIAWAIVEYLHNHPKFAAKTLFATHYHELNELAEDMQRVKNYNVSVRELNNKVVFMRKLKAGGSEHSFGIHVAQMAGMPNQIVIRANEIMEHLEQNKAEDLNVNSSSNSRQNSSSELLKTAKEQMKIKVKEIPKAYQMTLFESKDPNYEKIKEMLKVLDINTISPVEALLKLNEIKGLMK